MALSRISRLAKASRGAPADNSLGETGGGGLMDVLVRGTLVFSLAYYHL